MTRACAPLRHSVHSLRINGRECRRWGRARRGGGTAPSARSTSRHRRRSRRTPRHIRRARPHRQDARRPLPSRSGYAGRASAGGSPDRDRPQPRPARHCGRLKYARAVPACRSAGRWQARAAFRARRADRARRGPSPSARRREKNGRRALPLRDCAAWIAWADHESIFRRTSQSRANGPVVSFRRDEAALNLNRILCS